MTSIVDKKASAPGIDRRAWRMNDFCLSHGISRASAYEAMKNGELETIKVAGRRLVTDEAARAFLESGKGR